VGALIDAFPSLVHNHPRSRIPGNQFNIGLILQSIAAASRSRVTLCMQFRKILIIKPGAIGDLLHLTPVTRALKEFCPGVSITILVSSRITAALFENNPDVCETIVFDKKGEHRSLQGLFTLWRQLRERRFDLVLNFQRSNLKAWFLASAAFPCRLLVYHKARGRVVHAVVNHLQPLALLGIDPGSVDKTLTLSVGTDADAYADALFRSQDLIGKQVVALNPGASHPVNRWCTASFALLADRLAAELDARVVIVGGREDIALAEDIARLAASNPVNLAGATTLLQLGAILKRCNLLVSADTGPMHMATAVNTRVVALFGAADPARTGPVGRGHRVIQAEGVDCVPCRSRRCSSATLLECMEKITVEKVYRTIASMLANEED